MRSRWCALLAAEPPTGYREMVEWADATWEAEPPGPSRWFVLDDDDGALAVLHCHLTRRSVAGVPVRVLTNGSADGLLAARCPTELVRRELLRAFARGGERIDVLSLSGLRPGSAFHLLAGAWPGALRAEHTFGGYSTLATTVPSAAWFAAAGRNLRAGLRKARNRLDGRGDVRFTVDAAPDGVGTGFDAFVRMEGAGWKGRAGGGLLRRPVEHAQLRGFFTAAAEAGEGRVHVRSLWVGDDIAAVLLCVTVGPTVFVLKTTYEERFASGAPGNLLMADLVRACCDDPAVERIDLVTAQPWHGRWHPERHPTFRCRSFNHRTVTGLAGDTAARLRQIRAMPGR